MYVGKCKLQTTCVSLLCIFLKAFCDMRAARARAIYAHSFFSNMRALVCLSYARIRDFSSLTITAVLKNRCLQPSLFVVNYNQSIFIFLNCSECCFRIIYIIRYIKLLQIIYNTTVQRYRVELRTVISYFICNM